MEEPNRADLDDSSTPAVAAVARMTEHAGDMAARATESVAGFGRRTVEQLDAQRHPASQTLNRTAAALHRRADAVAGAAHATADRLQATADYVGGHDMKAMSTDAQGLVRRYPGPALLVAGILGFLVARAVRPRA